MNETKTRVLPDLGGDPADREVAAYAHDVRAALADLPESVRDELCEDLLENLQDTAAESEVGLVERLGTPRAYAEELRAAAGLVPERPAQAPGQRRERVRGAVRGLQARASREPVRGWLADLRVAWWALRGALLVALAATLLGLGQPGGLLDGAVWLVSRPLLSVPLVAAAVVASMRFGRRGVRHGWPRTLVLLGNTTLAFVAFVAVVGQGDPGYFRYEPTAVSPVSELTNEQGQTVSNIFPYDSQGNLLTDVFLYDQDGHPLNLPPYDAMVFPQDAYGREVRNLVPVPQTTETDEFGNSVGEATVVPPGTVVVPVMPSPSPSPGPGEAPQAGTSDSEATDGGETPAPAETVPQAEGTAP